MPLYYIPLLPGPFFLKHAVRTWKNQCAHIVLRIGTYVYAPPGSQKKNNYYLNIDVKYITIWLFNIAMENHNF